MEKQMQVPLITFNGIRSGDFDAIIDVRSPSEHSLDRIPGSKNLPALNDEERSHVGTVYKQESRFKARKIGAAIISRNVASHIEDFLFTKDRQWRPLIYCWRGGQRSFAFATILSQIGWRPTLLSGGYKNYRREVVNVLHKKHINLNLILVSGNTGTGKTEILNNLESLNTQTVDLEELANHRGSVLGGTDSCQPSQKLFESLLFEKLSHLDPYKPTFVEAESNKIGKLTVPSSFWYAMKRAKRVEIVAPIAERAKYLSKSYNHLTSNIEKLSQKLDYLINQQGKERVSIWKKLAKEKRYEELALQLMDLHYDKRYRNNRSLSQISNSFQVSLDKLDSIALNSAAKKLAALKL